MIPGIGHAPGVAMPAAGPGATTIVAEGFDSVFEALSLPPVDAADTPAVQLDLPVPLPPPVALAPWSHSAMPQVPEAHSAMPQVPQIVLPLHVDAPAFIAAVPGDDARGIPSANVEVGRRNADDDPVEATVEPATIPPMVPTLPVIAPAAIQLVLPNQPVPIADADPVRPGAVEPPAVSVAASDYPPRPVAPAPYILKPVASAAGEAATSGHERNATQGTTPVVASGRHRGAIGLPTDAPVVEKSVSGLAPLAAPAAQAIPLRVLPVPARVPVPPITASHTEVGILVTPPPIKASATTLSIPKAAPIPRVAAPPRRPVASFPQDVLPAAAAPASVSAFQFAPDLVVAPPAVPRTQPVEMMPPLTGHILDTGDGSLDLSTERLGAISVALEARETRVGVHFIVDTPVAAGLLGGSGPRLADALVATGGRLEGLSVDVRGGGGGGTGQRAPADAPRQPAAVRAPARPAAGRFA